MMTRRHVPKVEPAPISSSTAAVQKAVAAIAAGGMVVVVDGADRENEADLVAAASTVTSAQVAFIVAHTTGILCAPMTAERVEALSLRQMVQDNTDSHGTAFTITVDHVDSGTGVSAVSRARTFQALADPETRADELRRPGHVFPLLARAGGVLERAGHTEAAIDLLVLAGRPTVGVIGELVAPDGSMLAGAALLRFARLHSLPILAVADLIRFRRVTERLVEHVASAAMPTAFGEFRAVAYRSLVDGTRAPGDGHG